MSMPASFFGEFRLNYAATLPTWLSEVRKLVWRGGTFLNLPLVVIWGFTIVALLKVGWMVLRRIVLLFFPGLTTWLRRPVKSQEA